MPQWRKIAKRKHKPGLYTRIPGIMNPDNYTFLLPPSVQTSIYDAEGHVNMFKIGDIVRCMNNTNCQTLVALNQDYVVLDVSGSGGLVIQAGRGGRDWTRFALVRRDQ